MKGLPEIYYRSSKFSTALIKFLRSFSVHPCYFSMINQITRSSTSISANIIEAQNARSRKEFISSNTIALKEAEETRYWLGKIKDLNVVSSKRLNEFREENHEIVKVISTIVSSAKKNLEEQNELLKQKT